jgi:ABC-type Zn uptake system ZnuABC Zn-binding protein ZnuA
MRCFQFLFAIMALLVCGGCQRSDADPARIAVTTSYLECAAQDVLGLDERVLRLAEPGTCPGHFDIRPTQAANLRHCRALLRFDFQKSLDSILDGEGTNRPFVVEATVHGGLCQPESYLSVCRQLAGAFVRQGWMTQTNADARMRKVAARLTALEEDATNRVARAGLKAAPVIASMHQKDFCQSLGLNVVAAFRAADTASIAEMDKAIASGRFHDVKLIIANLPEGRRSADALADRLKARVGVFGNFPALEHDRVCFDDMVRENVESLVKASRP